MYLLPVSYDGFGLNTSDYRTIIPDNAPASWGADVVENKRANAFPQFASMDLDGINLPLRIHIRGNGSLSALKRVFNAEDYRLRGPRKLVVQDENGKQWYVYASARNLTSSRYNAVTVLVRVSAPVWISEVEQSVTWSVEADGDEKTVTVGGNANALPIFEVTPTTQLVGGFRHVDSLVLYNRCANRAVQFPMQIVSGWDTAALVSSGELQASCQDVRVSLDDVRIDFWLVRPNTTNTAIWANVNLAPMVLLKLAMSIPATGEVGELTFAVGSEKTLAGMSKYGYLLIDSEVFYYSGVDAKLRKVGGLKRAQMGSNMDDHVVGASCWWVEHKLQVLYGNSAADAWVNDESKRPAFDLDDSDNGMWVYECFGDSQQLQSAAAKPMVISSAGKVSGYYTDEHDVEADVSPFDVLGLAVRSYLKSGKPAGDTANVAWDLFHPFGIYSVAASGDKYRVGVKWPRFTVQKSANGSSWTMLAEETSPVNGSTWTLFVITEKTTGATSIYIPTRVRFSFSGTVDASSSAIGMVEITQATIKPVAGNVPVILRMAGSSNYPFEARLLNETSGDEIALSYQMGQGQTLVVDTERKVIECNGVGADAALAPYPLRGEWLPFLPGGNLLHYAAIGDGGVGIVIRYRERMVW